MAHYQQGNPAYHSPSGHLPSASLSPSQSHAYQPQYGSHTSQPTQEQHPMRRAPSFIAGDDADYIDDGRDMVEAGPGPIVRDQQWHTSAGAGSGYMAYSNINHNSVQSSFGSRHSQFSVGSSQHSTPSRASSHGSSGYHPYQPPTSPSHPAYNPQTFGYQNSQSQPISQSYGFPSYVRPGIAQYNGPVPAFQPYNPAAYQGTNLGNYAAINQQLQSTAASQRQSQSPSSPYGPQSAQMLSPLSPLSPMHDADHPHSSRVSRYANILSDTQYGYSSMQQSSLPPRSSAYIHTPTSPTSIGFAPGSFYSGLSVGLLPSPNSHGSQNSTHLPQVPRHFELNPLTVEHDQPPVPPSHQSFSDRFHRQHSDGLHESSGGSTSSLASQDARRPPFTQRTDPLTQHPQSRPLPGPPSDVEDGPMPFSGHMEFGGLNQRPGAGADVNELLREAEAAIKQSQPLGAGRHSSRTSRVGRGEQSEGPEPPPAQFPPSATLRLSPDERHTHTNGSMATGTGQYVNYGAYSDDSEAEAAAGLAMMQMADEEKQKQVQGELHHREWSETSASVFNTHESHTSEQVASLYQGTGSDSDYAGHDLSVYGGGYAAEMNYADKPTLSPGLSKDDAHVPISAAAASNSFSGSGKALTGETGHSDGSEYPLIEEKSIHPFPPHSSAARVDTGGTGGLSQPGSLGRRLSFDDADEGEDLPPHPGNADRSGSQSPERGEPDDLFFHPGMRPLPPAPVEPAKHASLLPHLIPAGTYRNQESSMVLDAQQRSLTTSDPDMQGLLSSPQFPRSTSLSTPASAPRAERPIRSKTDADRVKYKQQHEPSQQQLVSAMYETPLESTTITLDLPTIPAARRKRLNPAKLSSEQFKKCSEPWALSAIVTWIKEMSEDEADLKEQAIIDAIVALFTHKVPTMNIADAETLGSHVVRNMLDEGALMKEEEWVKFGSGALSGVLFQVTGRGCYSPRLHVQEPAIGGRCYSHHCMRTLKKIDLQAQVMEPEKKDQDWATFYNVPKEVWESYPKKEVDRQNNLHEIVTTEDYYIEQLNILRELYRDQLAVMQPPIISPKRLDKFLNDIFGKVDAVKKVNEDYLLAQLKYRQNEQGPFIAGFSDIFREWIRKAKTVYIDYAATFPNANHLVRKEVERNIQFRDFLNQARENKASNRLSWDTYLKAPITRIQRYTLLLTTVHKNMTKDTEEKANLVQAIEEIKVVAMECDTKVGEMTKKVDLLELSAKLQLRPEMKAVVELNLEHLGRQLIFQGDLQRPGTTRFNLIDTHAILFDNYLVLAKAMTVRDAAKSLKYETYDVSKLPIPMDLLMVESTNDDLVVKNTMKGISNVAPPPNTLRTPSPGDLMRTTTSNSVGSSSVSSGKTFVPSTTIDTSKEVKVLYPFRIRHLGKTGTYTLYAPTAQNRQDWCDKIIEAKTKHAASLFAQNAEPFRLRVLADTAFAYSEPIGPGGITIKGTPLDRAIKDVEERYAKTAVRPSPICKMAVNCATVFQQPPGRLMCAIGTDHGVYTSEYNDPRGWMKTIPISRVTQISTFEDFNLLLLIADKSLIAYHLDVVCPATGVPSRTSQHDSARRAPQKLSGHREVGFFAVGRMKDRTLVFYKKRDGISSTFKILEPVLQKSTVSRSRFFSSRRSQTESFRDYDEFYIPTETYNINLFHSSLAISTHRGIEVLTLEKKQTWSVPNLESEMPEAQAYLNSIASQIKDLRPLGMFRLSESEFLIAYTVCAVYVNQYGEVSRSVIMEFVGRANTACLYGKFLILHNDDFVEVRNAMNGRLRQVIPGRNVVCLDDGGNISAPITSDPNAASLPHHGANDDANCLPSMTNLARAGRTVKICMQHPEHPRNQIVIELIENEGQTE